MRRACGKVTNYFELGKDNSAAEDFAVVEESSPVDGRCTCCSAAALLTQPIILMPDNWIVCCQEEAWRQLLQGLSLSSGMQLMNYIMGLWGKHSTTLAPLQLQSLATSLLLLVAVGASFC